MLLSSFQSLRLLASPRLFPNSSCTFLFLTVVSFFICMENSCWAFTQHFFQLWFSANKLILTQQIHNCFWKPAKLQFTSMSKVTEYLQWEAGLMFLTPWVWQITDFSSAEWWILAALHRQKLSHQIQPGSWFQHQFSGKLWLDNCKIVGVQYQPKTCTTFWLMLVTYKHSWCECLQFVLLFSYIIGVSLLSCPL